MFRVLRISAGQPVSRAMTVLSIRTGKRTVVLSLTFPCQGCFYFLPHPLARHRRLGQDEEELVIDPDRLINPGAKSVADFHILRGKPAAYTLILEIGVQAFGKGVILARIADKAGVELEGVIEE